MISFSQPVHASSKFSIWQFLDSQSERIQSQQATTAEETKSKKVTNNVSQANNSDDNNQTNANTNDSLDLVVIVVLRGEIRSTLFHKIKFVSSRTMDATYSKSIFAFIADKKYVPVKGLHYLVAKNEKDRQRDNSRSKQSMYWRDHENIREM